jgi:hypothetical protein
MSSEPIPFPRVHTPGCLCGDCFAAAWRRADQISGTVMPFPGARPAPAPEPARPSLIVRFRDAAQPGDWLALARGVQLGIVICTVLILIDHRQLILDAIASAL